MHLSNILLAGLLSVITADSVKKDTATSVITPDTTAKDLGNIDCSKLTIDALKELKTSKACSGLTAECLDQFNVTNIGEDCLAAIKDEEWSKFSKKTVEQITSTAAGNLSITGDQLKAMIPKLKLESLNPDFTGLVARDNQLLKTLFETKDAKLIAAFLTADNMASLSLISFRRLGKTLITQFPDNAFSKISSTQLSMIQPTSCVGFTAKQCSQIKTEALQGLTLEQASHLPIHCWNAFTDAQIKNFGRPVSSAAQFISTDRSFGQTVLDRKEFKETHPCNALKVVKKELEEKQANTLEAQCKDLTEFKVNSANKLKKSITAVAVFGVAVMAFLI